MSGNPWESAIREFERRDRECPQTPGAILFVGSSSIVLWSTLEEDFKPLRVINRGFGGSQLADTVFYADRIILPYKPGIIVTYAGDNDIAAGKPPEAVRDQLRLLSDKVRHSLPASRILFLSIKPSPARWHLIGLVRRANALAEALARETWNLVYIDVFSPMLGPDGRPRPELFVEDGLHLSAQGYVLWTSILRPHLMR